ncbi:hypothetical protein LIER_28056 [Lithospermum erythrorhizon]|uniref:Uncharacterized protein n=1 Tax=Lithospermum erythrorhizon TaxID=34254 RepID=A0AAV3RIB5_LITER
MDLKAIDEGDSDEVKKEKEEHNPWQTEAVERKKDVSYEEDIITNLWLLSEEDKKNLSLNAKAINLLHNPLSEEDYGRIKAYKTAQEVWDCLEMDHVGTSKVKNKKIRLLTQEYEAFEMREGESITDMQRRLNLIVNNLQGFGKGIPTGELNSKILGSVTEEFNNKVCVIEEENNVSEIPSNELMGNLMVEELVVERNKTRKKGKSTKPTIVLQSTKPQRESQSNDENSKEEFEAEEEEVAHVVCLMAQESEVSPSTLCNENSIEDDVDEEDLSGAYYSMCKNFRILLERNKELILRNKTLAKEKSMLENEIEALTIHANRFDLMIQENMAFAK